MPIVPIDIRPIFDSEPAQKKSDRLAKSIANQGKQIDLAAKSSRKYIKESTDGLTKLERAAYATGRAFGTGLVGLEKFSKGIDGIISRVTSLRTLLAGSLIGAGLSKLYQMGREDRLSKMRIQREFGADAGAIEKLVSRADQRTGRSDTRAGIREIANATAGIADPRQRAKNRDFLVKMFERTATLAPDMNSQELGYLIADAGSGHQGMKSLIGGLGLNRSISMPVLEAARKGKLYNILSKDERKQFGVTKGQGYKPGTALDVILSRNQMTEKAADKYRESPEFQVQKKIAEVNQRLSDVGEKLVNKLGDFINSKGGKATLNAITGAMDFAGENAGLVGGGALGLGGLYMAAKGVGLLRRFLGKRAGAGGAIADMAGAAASGGAIPVFVTNMPGGGLSDAGGLLGGAAGKAGKLGRILPALGAALPWIGAAAAGGALGAGAGTLLFENKYVDLSSRITGTGRRSRVAADAMTDEESIMGRARRELSFARTLAGRVAGGGNADAALGQFAGLSKQIEGGSGSPFSRFVAEAIRRGDSKSLKMLESDPELLRQQLNTTGMTVNVNVQGDITERLAKKTGEEVTRQMIRQARISSAGGAAPASR